MESEKSHDLPFASWRSRKAHGVRPGMGGRRGEAEARTGDVSLHLNLKPGTPLSQGRRREDGCLNSSREREQLHPSSTFYSIWALSELDIAHPHWEGNLLYSVHQFKWESLLETPSQTHPEIMFYQLSRHPLAQSSWHKKINHHSNPI